MIKQDFRLNLLRRISLLSVVFADTTFIFGMDFIARIFEFKMLGKTYVSRSNYEENLYRFENDHQYRGQILVVPENESELPKILLTKKVKSSEVTVKTEMSRLNQSLCRKCKGKGLTDWIEDIVEPSQQWNDRCTDFEIDFTHAMLLNTYVQFDFYNKVTAFYRNRNLKKEYIQECKICQECYGVGFDDAFLESYIPTPIVENIFTAVQTRLELDLSWLDAEEIDPSLRDPT